MTRETMRIFAAGAAHMDRRGRASRSFALGASNPGVMRQSPGGAVLNAAMALRRLGAEVALFSGRGGDLDASLVADAVLDAGIEDFALTWLDRRTPGYTAILDDLGDLVAGIADMELYDLLSPRVLSRRHLRATMAGCTALVLDANLPEPGIVHLLKQFAGRPSAAIGVSPAKVVRFAGHLRDLSMIFLSRAEATALVEASAGTGVETLARLLAETGARRAVVTDGPNDVAILDDGAIFLQAPRKAPRLQDVTGAGDTLAAVASFSVFRGGSFVAGARRGMAAATLRVSADDATGGDYEDMLSAIVSEMPPPQRLESDTV